MTSAPMPTRSLGGDAKDIKVGAIGHGLMMLTSTPVLGPDEKAFESMKQAVDSGATFWNSSQFYNTPENPMANLKLLGRFFEKYPEYLEVVILSVKGGLGPTGFAGGFDSSLNNLRADLARINEALGGVKQIDIYEPARVDPKLTIEEAVENLVVLQKEGLFRHIGLSEIHPDALRKAAKVAPIAAVEVELSLFSLEPEVYGIIEVCKEFDIALIAYSPLGRGFLAGKYRSLDDFAAGDLRRHAPRFQGDNFKQNLKLLDAVDALANEKGCTNAQLALAYIMEMYEKVIPIPGSTSAQRVKSNLEAASVKLTSQETEAVNEVLKGFKPSGERYPAAFQPMSWGKGKQE